MTGTSTSRIGLYKPNGADDINVGTDLNANFDKIDLNVGFRSCTSTTRPSTVWSGLAIRETDTGRTYVSSGSTPASGSWFELYGQSGSFTIAGSNQLQFASAVGVTPDVNLYRGGSNILKTDDTFQSAVTTITTGVTYSTGWASSDFVARKTNGVTYLYLVVNRSGSDLPLGTTSSGTEGNITPDLTIATLPSTVRPTESVNCAWGNGTIGGEAIINADGTVVLRCYFNGNSSVISSTNVRLCASWIN